MYILKRGGILLSLALLAGLMLSIGASPVVEAHGDIVSEFALVDNPLFTPGDGFGAGGSGNGVFKLDGRHLDDLEFDLNMDAEDLMPDTWYYLAVTVREGFGGVAVPVAFAVAGMARTDGAGRLEFEGEGVLPNVFDDPSPGITTWRIDQQVRLLGSPTENFCVECTLVCSPTTKVELNGDGQLVLFDTEDSHPGNGSGDEKHEHSGPPGHD